MDDTHHLRIDYVFNRVRPLDRRQTIAHQDGEILPDRHLVRNAANRYLQDRAEMKTRTFTGMGPYFPAHDAFATESAGPIHDRTRERLATGDVCIAAARRLLIDAIRAVGRGEDPPHVIRDAAENDLRDMQVVSIVVGEDVDYRNGWRDAVRTLRPPEELLR
jgi:hypothetical protein